MLPRYPGGPIYRDLVPPGKDREELADLVRQGTPQQKEKLRCYLSEAYVRFWKLENQDREGFASYAAELDCLHEDFDFILFELEGAVNHFYSDNLDLKRLALIYHEDNFYYRIHAYREKLFKLINHALGLKLRDDSRAVSFNKEVLERLQDTGFVEIAELLENLPRDRIFSKFIARRNRLSHGLAEREKGWATITTERRIEDRIDVTSDVDQIDRVTDLDRLHKQKQSELGDVCERLARFRRELVAALTRVGL